MAPEMQAGGARGGRLPRLARSLIQAGLDGSPLRGRLFWWLPAEERGVALTFDDGPDPERTPEILDILAAAGARATFFVIGQRALEHPELVRRMAAEGHTVGNHTHSHARCRGLSPAELREELEQADRVIHELRPGAGPPLFRPPYGELRPEQAWGLARRGRRMALWSLDSRDYKGATAEAVAALGEGILPRDIVLLHDRFPATVEGLPAILAGLSRRGLNTIALGGEREPHGME